MGPFPLSLLSLKGKFGDWDSREKLAPVHETFVAGVSATETGATYRSGCLRSGKLTWTHTSVARRDPPIKPGRQVRPVPLLIREARLLQASLADCIQRNFTRLEMTYLVPDAIHFMGTIDCSVGGLCTWIYSASELGKISRPPKMEFQQSMRRNFSSSL